MGTVNSRTACHYCKVRSGICHPRVPRPHVMLSSCHARTRRGSTGGTVNTRCDGSRRPNSMCSVVPLAREHTRRIFTNKHESRRTDVTPVPPVCMTSRTRTLGVAFERLVPDEGHRRKIRDAVERTHRATLLATELINFHVRHRLEHHAGSGLETLFDSNWLNNVYNEVTVRSRKTKVVPELRDVVETRMPDFEPVDGDGLTQILKYECINLAAVAATNVWMHFRKRVLSHVKMRLALSEESFNALTKDQKRVRRLELMQVAADLLRPPSEQPSSPSERHEWVASERERLGIDVAVGDWDGKPVDYHLKARPHCFLPAMYRMALDRKEEGRSSFSLFPLRRAMVPRHARFDQVALRSLLGLGRSDYDKQAAKRLRTETGKSDVALESSPKTSAGGRAKKRSKEEMRDEKAELFAQVLDLRAAKMRQSNQFDHAFTTDGVCVRLQCAVAKAAPHSSSSSGGAPTRGRFAIDELKRVSRLSEADLHVVGIDPGKRELVVAVDQDDPVKAPVVRYTSAERRRDLRTRQYAAEHLASLPNEVVVAEEALSLHDSRSPIQRVFYEYCVERRKAHEVALAHYAQLAHRRRRWKTVIKTQQSEELLFSKLRGIHKKGDERTLVLAYGSWGAVAGRAGAACNRGNPPCVGVGLMNKLAKRFVVALTPEQYTSKTCCHCLGPCGPWEWLEEKEGRKIRGARVCQNEECRLPQNRDRTGASNIGLQFRRLYRGEAPIRRMTDEDLAFHRENVALCMPCDL